MKKHISEIVKGDRFRVFRDVHIAVSDAQLTDCDMGKVWNVHVDDEDGTEYIWAYECEAGGMVEYIPLAQDEGAAKGLIESLKEIQESGFIFEFPCPRCGHTKMCAPPVRNAISRYADVYICSDCGMDEAMMDFAGMPPLPFTQWGMALGFAEEECSDG